MLNELDFPPTRSARGCSLAIDHDPSEGNEAKHTLSETEMEVPEFVTPLLLNRPEYSARIFITAYEHSINDREERTVVWDFR